MGLRSHPEPGTVVTVDYDRGFVPPEMTKLRLAVVLTPDIKVRHKLVTVVPLSTTPPERRMPYHARIDIPFKLPKTWNARERWIKGDMVNAVGFHRVNLLRLAKDRQGRPIYQYETLPDDIMKTVRRCVLHGLGLSDLTKHL